MGNLICSKLSLYNEDKITYLAKQMMKDVIEVIKKTDDDIFIDVTLHDKSTNNACTIFITQHNEQHERYITYLNESAYLGKDSLIDSILEDINKKKVNR